MAGHGDERIDVLRKGLIVLIMVAAMVGLHRVAAPQTGFDPTGMLALGFVVLAGYTFGELVGVIKLPHITGYLFAGLLLGESLPQMAPDILESLLGPAPTTHGYQAWLLPPFDKGILHHDVIEQLSIFNTLALALIAITAGGELKIETLRKGLKHILAILSGQTIAIFVALPLLIIGLSRIAQPSTGLGSDTLLQAIGPLAGLSITSAATLGLVVAAISLATSPAATIAIINSSGAKGSYTTNVLSAVVLKDVLVVMAFAVTGAVAASVVGGQAISLGDLGQGLSVHIGGSLGAGVLVGGLVALYLRYINAEVLLFLVAVIFSASFAAEQLHLDRALLFIAAGFTAANFSREGDRLVHEVERISLPVYVVFFTLTGAHLELHTLYAMAPFAVAMVATRALALYIGVRAGARLARSPDNLRRHGWLGFLSQAGVAIVLAAQLRGEGGEPGILGPDFIDLGNSLAVLVISGVALNEIIGPVALKIGLGWAGDIPSAEAIDDDEPTTEAVPDEGLTPWQGMPTLGDPWGPPADTSSTRLNRTAERLQVDLIGLASDVQQGPLAAYTQRHEDYLRQLRRAFLRHHRHISVATTSADDASKKQEALRGQLGALADPWRTIVLAHAGGFKRAGWNPMTLVEAIDSLCDEVPVDVKAPFEPESLAARREESVRMVLLRAQLRGRRRADAILSGGGLYRLVKTRKLARYHFSGELPTRLEALPAVLITGEHHLASRTASLFETIRTGYEQVASALDDPDQVERLAEMLTSLRREVEEEFSWAGQEVEQIASDALKRTVLALGQTLKTYKAELITMNTLDVPSRTRRFSRVFGARTAAEATLTEGLRAARSLTAARFETLALELELERLDGHIQAALETHGDKLARSVRGRGVTQTERVMHNLDACLVELHRILETEHEPQALALAIREACDPLDRAAASAARATGQLREQLQGDQVVLPLIRALLDAAQDLTETYRVPARPIEFGEWMLPAATPIVDVPFREVVMGFVETTVTRNLLDLLKEVNEGTETLFTALEEFERVVAFNVELAGGELALVESDTVPSASVDLVREMVVGTLGRSQQRLAQAHSAAHEWGDHIADRLDSAVRADLGTLREQLVQGRASDLRTRILREAARGERLMRRAGGVDGLIAEAEALAQEWALRIVGPVRLRAVRVALGLPVPLADTRPGAEDFAAPSMRTALPLVYRRLFSDHAMEAGDLLIGRSDELERAHRALSPDHNGLMAAVAVVGPDGAGKGAVVSALARSLEARSVRRLALEGPITADEVRAWFDPGREGCLHVVTGFHWLLSLEPGGLEPVRALVEGLIADRGRNQWLLSADEAVWQFACRATPLGEALRVVVELGPLDQDNLEAAVLARHAMSGYSLDYSEVPGFTWRLRDLFTESPDTSARRQAAWFAALHYNTGGLIEDALRVWMASIERVDERGGRMHLGLLPNPYHDALERLPDQDLLTLRQVSRQGWMTSETHATMFRLDAAHSEAHLAHLHDLGLLRWREGSYAIADHLRSASEAVLKRRGWLG